MNPANAVDLETGRLQKQSGVQLALSVGDESSNATARDLLVLRVRACSMDVHTMRCEKKAVCLQ